MGDKETLIYEDEEPDCEYFQDLGLCNFCAGNEPYRCHRAKEEGLCHKLKQAG